MAAELCGRADAHRSAALAAVETLESVSLKKQSSNEQTLSREQVQLLEKNVRSNTAALQRTIQDLEDAALDAKRLQDSENIRRSASEYADVLREIQRRYRSSIVAAYKAADAHAALERANLLQASAMSSDRNDASKASARISNEAAVRASKDVTEGLRQAVQMMSAEVERSAAATHLLQESTQTLRRTQDQHSTLSSMINSSASLIRDLVNRDATDRWLLAAGISLFSATIMYIVLRRIGVKMPSVWSLLPTLDDNLGEL